MLHSRAHRVVVCVYDLVHVVRVARSLRYTRGVHCLYRGRWQSFDCGQQQLAPLGATLDTRSQWPKPLVVLQPALPKYGGSTCGLPLFAVKRRRSAPSLPQRLFSLVCQPTRCSAVFLLLCAYRWSLGRSDRLRSCRQQRPRRHRRLVLAHVRGLCVQACADASDAYWRTQVFGR